MLNVTVGDICVLSSILLAITFLMVLIVFLYSCGAAYFSNSSLSFNLTTSSFMMRVSFSILFISTPSFSATTAAVGDTFFVSSFGVSL
ncbi:hypothetical protein SDC9_140928 [bioreactor metagenome]|uniref:Uncharacterized protein n=1 Tax=bioreactor metagenome TaxID=1076179 RepID=A0A645DWS0_9ZZZZ